MLRHTTSPGLTPAARWPSASRRGGGAGTGARSHQGTAADETAAPCCDSSAAAEWAAGTRDTLRPPPSSGRPGSDQWRPMGGRRSHSKLLVPVLAYFPGTESFLRNCPAETTQKRTSEHGQFTHIAFVHASMHTIKLTNSSRSLRFPASYSTVGVGDAVGDDEMTRGRFGEGVAKLS